MIKAIIFDFDGVILESARIKTEAFGEIVSNYPPNIAEEFVKYHNSHMGISRHIKFKYFIEKILNEAYSEDKEKELADKFASIVFDKILSCDFVPGAKKFLDNNYLKLDLYIASGTPCEEIHQIIDRRNLSKYFKKVYGSPLKKEQIVNIILSENSYDKSEVIFVGDANTDMNAANYYNLLFVGRNTPDNTETFANVKYKVDDISQISEVIREINGD